MNRAARMRADIYRLAPQGDSPELHAAVTAYTDQCRRDVERMINPRWQRALDWYMRLPHNRYLFSPAWSYLTRHIKITLPVACLALVGEVLLIAQPWQ